MRIGVISDTHGLLRPQAVKALQGAEHVLHAGDIGDPAILDALRAIAPVTAIRGNIDEGGPCGHLPPTELAELSGHGIYMLHDVKKLDLKPEAAGIAAVVFGHSHKPLIEWRHDVLFLNPGSAGPRRFELPVTLAWLNIEAGKLSARIVQLDV
ncbi:MAG: metallophosphoesterase family protein [Bryobacteraceae bacterium]